MFGPDALDPTEVVITGVGAVGNFGTAPGAFADALRSGASRFVSAASALEGAPPLEPMLAAPIPHFDAASALGRKGTRALNREAAVLCHAANLALADAHLEASDCASPGTGVFVGTQLGGVHDYVTLHMEGITWGRNRVSPLLGPNSGFNAPAAHLSIRLGATGENHTLVAGGASGLHALHAAMRALARGRVERALVGGVDCLSYLRQRADILGGSSGHDPPRPFDRSRRRPVPGEAAAVLVLETAAWCASRGATPLAVVEEVRTGYGPPAGEVEASALTRLLRQMTGAGETDLVVASAAGDPLLDGVEARALEAVLGRRLASVPVAAILGLTGSCAGANAALQLVAAVISLRAGLVPGVAGYVERDESLPRLDISAATRERDAERALVTAVDATGFVGAAMLRRCAS